MGSWEVYLKPSAVQCGSEGVYSVRGAIYCPEPRGVQRLLDVCTGRLSMPSISASDAETHAVDLDVNVLGGAALAILSSRGYVFCRTERVLIENIDLLARIYPDLGEVRRTDPLRFDLIKRNNVGCFLRVEVSSNCSRLSGELGRIKHLFREAAFQVLASPGQRLRDNLLHIPRDETERATHAEILRNADRS